MEINEKFGNNGSYKTSIEHNRLLQGSSSVVNNYTYMRSKMKITYCSNTNTSAECEVTIK